MMGDEWIKEFKDRLKIIRYKFGWINKSEEEGRVIGNMWRKI